MTRNVCTPLSSFLLLDMNLCLSVVYIPSETWIEWSFLCKWLSLGFRFLVRGDNWCSVPLLALGPGLAWTCAGPVDSATVSVVHMYLIPIVSGRPYFLDVIYPLWLLKSLPLFCISPWVLSGGFDEEVYNLGPYTYYYNCRRT